jgi:hypothetical protein
VSRQGNGTGTLPGAFKLKLVHFPTLWVLLLFTSLSLTDCQPSYSPIMYIHADYRYRLPTQDAQLLIHIAKMLNPNKDDSYEIHFTTSIYAEHYLKPFGCLLLCLMVTAL